MTPDDEHDLLVRLIEAGVPWWLAREAIATVKLEQGDDT